MVTPMILAQVAQPQAIFAQIVSVGGGDALTIRNVRGQNIVIRLGCIDAPERNQPGGKESAQRLSTLLPKGVTVMFEPFGDKDQYGRTPGVVLRGSQFINLELVQEGQAWIDEKEINRCQAFAQQFRQAQVNAQKQRLGLWSQANPCPPWDYRSNKCEAIRQDPPEDPPEDSPGKRTSPGWR